MVDHLTEQKLLQILLQVQRLADHNKHLTSQELVKEIEIMLLQKSDTYEKLIVNT